MGYTRVKWDLCVLLNVGLNKLEFIDQQRCHNVHTITLRHRGFAEACSNSQAAMLGDHVGNFNETMYSLLLETLWTTSTVGSSNKAEK